MVNILQTFRDQMSEENVVVQQTTVVNNITDGQFNTPNEGNSTEVDLTSVLDPLVIKENNPGMPLHGFTLQTMADELGRIIELAMHKAGVNSVSADVVGEMFLASGAVPRGFRLEEDPYNKKQYLILRNSKRDAEIHRRLAVAINKTSGTNFSFNHEVDTTLHLPLKANGDKTQSFTEVKTKSLAFTASEIKSLNYSFIKKVMFCKKNIAVENSRDLLLFEIDKELWLQAPYRGTES